jgi:hypothetical protein
VVTGAEEAEAEAVLLVDVLVEVDDLVEVEDETRLDELEALVHPDWQPVPQ